MTLSAQSPIPTRSEGIKYRYAQNQHTEVVDINNLNAKNDRADYICLGCGGILRPAFGTKRKSHFRHKVAQECSPETYLHKMGIKLFYSTYLDCLEKKIPFHIDIPQKNICTTCQEGPCFQSVSYINQDLTEKFTDISVETHTNVDGDVFVPDILLSCPNGDMLYVEIVVTHFSTDEKIGSGIPIIEFQLKSEEDLELIKGRKFSHQNDAFLFHNVDDTEKVCDVSATCSKWQEKIKALSLQRMAKETFVNTYNEALTSGKPFYIHYSVPVICNYCEDNSCLVDTKSESVDLTQHFHDVRCENNSDSEILTAYLINESGRKLYFETKSLLSEKSFSKGEQAIIFDIQNESDIEILSLGSLYPTSHPDKKNIVSTYAQMLSSVNFNPKEDRGNRGDECTNWETYFIVFKSGKSVLKSLSKYEWKELQRKNNITYFREVDHEGPNAYIAEVELAYRNGAHIKNCYLCRYHAGANNSYRNDEGGIFCKHLKKRHRSNHACDCPAYKPDENVFGSVRYRAW